LVFLRGPLNNLPPRPFRSQADTAGHRRATAVPRMSRSTSFIFRRRQTASSTPGCLATRRELELGLLFVNYSTCFDYVMYNLFNLLYIYIICEPDVGMFITHWVINCISSGPFRFKDCECHTYTILFVRLMNQYTVHSYIIINILIIHIYISDRYPRIGQPSQAIP